MLRLDIGVREAPPGQRGDGKRQMTRRVIALLIGIMLALPAGTAPALAAGLRDCSFVLGFAALHALIPNTVGDCVDNEQHNPANGDAIQHTTNGLLVWRKHPQAGTRNYTAFTDGYRTWVNGPYGLEERLNTQRFPWEAGGSGGPYQLVEPAAANQILRYYAFINQRDYANAYALLASPTQTYAQFVAGYRDTAHVDVALGLPEGNNAAGHIGLDIPTVLLAERTDGTLAGYAGCYTVETLNPGVLSPGTPPPPWQIATAEIQPLPGISNLDNPTAQQALAGPCPGHQA